MVVSIFNVNNHIYQISLKILSLITIKWVDMTEQKNVNFEKHIRKYMQWKLAQLYMFTSRKKYFNHTWKLSYLGHIHHNNLPVDMFQRPL